MPPTFRVNVRGLSPGAIVTVVGSAVPPSWTDDAVNAPAGSWSKPTTNVAAVPKNADAFGLMVVLAPVVSNDPDRLAPPLVLPDGSAAAPAGTLTLNAPSATRSRARGNVRPSP